MCATDGIAGKAILPKPWGAQKISINPRPGAAGFDSHSCVLAWLCFDGDYGLALPILNEKKVTDFNLQITVVRL